MYADVCMYHSIKYDWFEHVVYSHIFGELLLVRDGTLDGFEEVFLRLEYVGDGGHPFVARF